MLLLNDKPVKFFTFPGGELQVNVGNVSQENPIKLTWKPLNSEDIMLLLLTVNAIRQQYKKTIVVEALYLPYARQDRVCAPGEALSLQVIGKLLDSMNVDLRLIDVHNIKNFYKYYDNYYSHWDTWEILLNTGLLKKFDTDNLILCAPDESAAERIDLICQNVAPNLKNYFKFTKVRHPETGQIKGYKTDMDFAWLGTKNILVIDDICDGGATFIECAKQLKKHTKSDIFLYVTHGIFSKGLDLLKPYYKHIYCCQVLDDSKYKSNEFLTILREYNVH